MLTSRRTRPRYPLDDSWLCADPMSIAVEFADSGTSLPGSASLTDARASDDGAGRVNAVLADNEVFAPRRLRARRRVGRSGRCVAAHASALFTATGRLLPQHRFTLVGALMVATGLTFGLGLVVGHRAVKTSAPLAQNTHVVENMRCDCVAGKGASMRTL